ncbi:hypothetical protein HDU93_000669 [Gonapodya sp. JEL0774]|nr:hypothetical protein HDU93_000669 [Gonapodya sp. JEL0774]
MNDWIYPFIKTHLWPVEYAFVFLPYFWRAAFPQTRLRDTVPNLRKNRSTYNFYMTMMQVTRGAMLFGKHIIGLHLNYLRYLGSVVCRCQWIVAHNNLHFIVWRFTNALNPTDIRFIYMTLISGSFATTIAIFLHTLRFKGYLPGWVAYSMYVASFVPGGLAFVLHGGKVFTEHPYIAMISIGGLLANRIPTTNRIFDAYQLGVLTMFHWKYVNAYGTWSEVFNQIASAWTWTTESMGGAQPANATVNAFADQAKAALAYALANPEGVAGKMW